MNEMTQQLDLPLWDPIVYVTNTATSGTCTFVYGSWIGWSRDYQLRMFVKRAFGVLIIAAMFIVPSVLIGLI